MSSLPNSGKPLLDRRFVCYRYDIRRNALASGNSHSACAEKAGETFHRQFGHPKLGDSGDLRRCSSALRTGDGEESCSARLRLRIRTLNA